MPAVRMMATAEAAGLKVVMGHGFGLDMSTMAEIMVGASSSNILTGLECVGPLKVKDTVSQTRLDISSGSLKVPDGAGLAMDLDMEKLAKYTVQ
jgi:muconate cycloisomerase